MATQRLFFSVVPQPDVLLEIDQWRKLNWPLLDNPVPLANLHITMTFLGETSASQLQKIRELLTDFKWSDIHLELDDLGFWPDSEVLWLGCKAQPASMLKLSKHCQVIAAKVGLKVSHRDFKTHLTLARRVKTPPAAPLVDARFHCQLSELLLQRSIRSRTGVHYLTLSRW